MIKSNDRYIYINTSNSSYIMQILPDGIVRHCYYGRRIPILNMDYYNLYEEFDCTAPYFIGENCTTLDALPQECPSSGRGDYRTPAVVIENLDGRKINDFRYVSHIVYKGAPTLNDLPHLDVNVDEAETLEITLQDTITHIKLKLVYCVFDNIDVIARHIEVINDTDNTLKLTCINSAVIDFETSDFEMISLFGRWANERTIERYKLHHGKSEISSNRGATGHHSCPFAALVKSDTNEYSGEVYGISLIYSGDFKISAEENSFGGTRLVGGINSDNFSWQLNSSDAFISPQAVLTYSSEGISKMSRNFHEMCRMHLGASAKVKKHPIVLNMWEAFYFDVNEEKVLNVIEQASDFGIDTVVLDDGWFGCRQDDTSSLGDWFINKNKFPNGFDKIIELCNQKNISFGIWFEPESISPSSELYRAHPDWCIHSNYIDPVKSRNELLLDFSREEVVEEIYTRVSTILTKYDIRYVKWDMNRNFTDAGSGAISTSQQGEFAHRYILGVYSLMSRLSKDFPNVFFEGSSGGGGRFDFGILYYMPQIWASDNSDAIGRLNIQCGTSLVFPPESISAHVSICPNHQTNRTTPFKTRGDVAQLFSLGYELNPQNIDETTKQELIEQIVKHRELEDWLIDADFYRLKYSSVDDSCAWQMVSKDKSKSIVVYTVKLTQPRRIGEYVRLKGLNESTTYNVQPMCIDVSGDFLMFAGLPIKGQFDDFESLFIEITKQI